MTHQLRFPLGCRINPSFHVSRLIPYRWATPGTDVFPDYCDPTTMIDPDEFLTQNDTLNDETSSVSTERFLTANDALADDPELAAPIHLGLQLRLSLLHHHLHHLPFPYIWSGPMMTNPSH